MGTIIQSYGPIYGEVVNGTVQGRPNGSVYVPISNSITVSIEDAYKYVKSIAEGAKYAIVICNSSAVLNTSHRVTAVAVSQDLANNIQVQIADSSDFSNIIGTRDSSAGLFNVTSAYVCRYLDTDPLTTGNTYYIRAVLMANGTPVAVSSSIPVEAVEE